jgi:hypothetical protein
MMISIHSAPRSTNIIIQGVLDSTDIFSFNIGHSKVFEKKRVHNGCFVAHIFVWM